MPPDIRTLITYVTLKPSLNAATPGLGTSLHPTKRQGRDIIRVHGTYVAQFLHQCRKGQCRSPSAPTDSWVHDWYL